MAVIGVGPSSNYTDYYTTATNASTSAFQNTLGKVNEKSTEAELMNACKEFEAYFIEQIYKGMEKTIMKADNGVDSSVSQYKELFGDMQIQEYAKQAANQGDGIGLANQLYEQMKRNYGL
ncbi:MAG: rod-binding protein [Eubacteriales bacterium]|nr:rod-binding protein [Eubacteriales bacterium]